MNTNALARPVLILAALFLALSLASACGDDDGPSSSDDGLRAYFTDLQLTFQAAEDATNKAEEGLNQGTSGTALDTQLSAVDTYLSAIDGIFNDALGRLSRMSVPAIAAGDHEAFIGGVFDSVSAGSALREDLRGISTEEQLSNRLAAFDGDVGAATEQGDAACLSLQAIADAESIDVDLDCEN